jgi:serine/threonine protein kinase
MILWQVASGIAHLHRVNGSVGDLLPSRIHFKVADGRRADEHGWCHSHRGTALALDAGTVVAKIAELVWSSLVFTYKSACRRSIATCVYLLSCTCAGHANGLKSGTQYSIPGHNDRLASSLRTDNDGVHAYMAPERQREGKGIPASNVYSFGKLSIKIMINLINEVLKLVQNVFLLWLLGLV